MLDHIGQNKYSPNNLYLQYQYWNSWKISNKEVDDILYKFLKSRTILKSEYGKKCHQNQKLKRIMNEKENRVNST